LLSSKSEPDQVNDTWNCQRHGRSRRSRRHLDDFHCGSHKTI